MIICETDTFSTLQYVTNIVLQMGAKLLITYKRNRLKNDIIEVCTLLRHWLEEGGTI